MTLMCIKIYAKSIWDKREKRKYKSINEKLKSCHLRAILLYFTQSFVRVYGHTYKKKIWMLNIDIYTYLRAENLVKVTNYNTYWINCIWNISQYLINFIKYWKLIILKNRKYFIIYTITTQSDIYHIHIL